MVDTASINVETVLVKKTGVTLSNFWLLRIIQGVILQRIAIESVYALVGARVVVSSKEKKAAIVDHCGMSPAFCWMVGFLGLKHPLEFFKLAGLTTCLHTSFSNFY